MSDLTTLKIINGTSDPVDIYFTLGTNDGNVTTADMSFLTSIYDAQKGMFTLGANATQEYTNPEGKNFNGHFAIGAYALNCPDRTLFPNGQSLFEFFLNVPVATGAFETCDISCVYGCNAHFSYTMNGGGAGWTVDNGKQTFTSGSNLPLNENTNRVGVFPYGCQFCTSRANPTSPCGPAFTNQPSSSPICQAMRDAAKAGGTVEVTYKGAY